MNQSSFSIIKGNQFLCSECPLIFFRQQCLLLLRPTLICCYEATGGLHGSQHQHCGSSSMSFHGSPLTPPTERPPQLKWRVREVVTCLRDTRFQPHIIQCRNCRSFRTRFCRIANIPKVGPSPSEVWSVLCFLFFFLNCSSLGFLRVTFLL